MVEITRISKYGFVNCYLVPEDDGLTLVDTMLPGAASRSWRRPSGWARRSSGLC